MPLTSSSDDDEAYRGRGGLSSKPVYCVCKSTDVSRFMIGCEHCEDWFHGDCINLTPKDAKYIKRFYCRECRRKNPGIKIVYKSSYLEKMKEKEKEREKEKAKLNKDKEKEEEERMRRKRRAERKEREREERRKARKKEEEEGERKRKEEAAAIVAAAAARQQKERMALIAEQKAKREAMEEEKASASASARKESSSSDEAKRFQQQRVTEPPRESAPPPPPPPPAAKKTLLRERNSSSSSDGNEEERGIDQWEPPTVKRGKERQPQLPKKRQRGVQGQSGMPAAKRGRRRDARSSDEDEDEADFYELVTRGHAMDESRPRHCYGPNCTRSARHGSKYCSDECGLSLAKQRILQALPDRIREWNMTPCHAEKKDRKEQEDVKRKQQELQRRLNDLNVDYDNLELLIKKGKELQLEEGGGDSDGEEESVEQFIHCVTCGASVQAHTAIRHMERCYNKVSEALAYVLIVAQVILHFFAVRVSDVVRVQVPHANQGPPYVLRLLQPQGEDVLQTPGGPLSGAPPGPQGWRRGGLRLPGAKGALQQAHQLLPQTQEVLPHAPPVGEAEARAN